MSNGKAVELALLGAGARGELNLGLFVKRYPREMRFVAVAEADDDRRERFIAAYGIPREHAFRDWRDLVARPRLAEAMINTLPCHIHYESTLGALEAGYPVLLEKPMAHDPGQCVHLVETARRKGVLLAVSLQCRLNRIYTLVKQMLEDGAIGELIHIDCAENIGYWHFAMSYVRGMHSQSPTSHSFMISKGIHDVDLINWFAGAKAAQVSSVGCLSFFNEAHAPEGVPERCTDGCPVQDSCIYDAVKQFVDPGGPSIPPRLLSGITLGTVLDYLREPRLRTLASTIVRDIRPEKVLENLRTTNNGRCVFRSPNDVVDHQSVSLEYDNGVTVSFSLNGHSLIWERTLNFHGSKGEILTKDFTGHLEWRTYHPARVRKKRIRYHGIFHGGGDEQLIRDFARAVREDNPSLILSQGDSILESHLLGFACEEARRSGSVMDMEDYRKQAAERAAALSGN